jgi:hypothetical protein
MPPRSARIDDRHDLEWRAGRRPIGYHQQGHPQLAGDPRAIAAVPIQLLNDAARSAELSIVGS